MSRFAILISAMAVVGAQAEAWSNCRNVPTSSCDALDSTRHTQCYQCKENSQGIQCVACDDFPDNFDEAWSALWTDYSYTALFWLSFAFSIVACLCAGLFCISCCVRLVRRPADKTVVDPMTGVAEKKKSKFTKKPSALLFGLYVIMFFILLALGIVAIVALALAPRDVDQLTDAIINAQTTFTDDYAALNASVATPIGTLPTPYNPEADTAVRSAFASLENTVTTANSRTQNHIDSVYNSIDTARHIFYALIAVIGGSLIFLLVGLVVMLPGMIGAWAIGLCLALIVITIFMLLIVVSTGNYFLDDGCQPFREIDNQGGYDSQNALNPYNNACATIINGGDVAESFVNGSDLTPAYCNGVANSVCLDTAIRCMQGATGTAAYDFTSSASACTNGTALLTLPANLYVTNAMIPAQRATLAQCAAAQAPCATNTTLQALAQQAIDAQVTMLQAINTTNQQYNVGGMFVCSYIPASLTGPAVQACDNIEPDFKWASWQAWVYAIVLLATLILFLLQQCLRPCRFFPKKKGTDQDLDGSIRAMPSLLGASDLGRLQAVPLQSLSAGPFAPSIAPMGTFGGGQPVLAHL